VVSPSLIPRLAEQELRASLADTPIVFVQGPRQCGKTTLVQQVGTKRGYQYLSLDEHMLLESARRDPTGFVHRLPKLAILDEVQRVPELFLPLKAAVDRGRVPGRFMLTGSTNVLLMPKLADSLAGRLASIRLHPLAQCEIERTPPRFLTDLLKGSFPLRRSAMLGEQLAERMVGGGFPAALARSSPGRRRKWYLDYIDSLVQRDVRDLARVSSLETLPRLLKAAAAMTARLLNVTELGSSFGLSRPTIRDYVTLLARLYLLDELQPWHSNRLSRLVKTPKLHLADTGVACALLGISAAALWRDRTLLGQMLESFVLAELRRQASGQSEPIDLWHFRDRDGVEVDFVVGHAGDRISGIEVKASATVHASDLRGLRQLRAAAGKKFGCGVVLYDGEHAVGMESDLFCVPLAALWA